MGEYESGEVREKRYRAMLREITRLSPDVIGINEANFLPDYVKRLAGDIGYDYIYHVGVAGLHVGRVGLPWNLKEGDAILAKKDLKLSCVGRKQLSGGGFIWNNLSFHTQDATQAVLGKIRVNGEDVYIAVTHWHASPPNDESSRKELSRLRKVWNYSEAEYRDALQKLEADYLWRDSEAKDMAAYLKEKVPAGAKIIALGDFNAAIESPEMKRFLAHGYFDIFKESADQPGYTWDARRNSNIRKFYLGEIKKRFDSLYEHLNTTNEGTRKRIDFILLNEGFAGGSAVKALVCCDGFFDGVQPSDHFGVYGLINLK
jgi:endonuclease/exonuclease/phosphatase family metal-dependent hydrolase